MRRIKEALEAVSNVLVIVGVIVVGVIFYRAHATSDAGLRLGDHLPQLVQYGWSSHQHSLLIVVRDGCHYCQESMPFYRKLVKLRDDGHTDIGIVAVSPDSRDVATKDLVKNEVNIPVIAPFELSRLKVFGTPALILVDHNGVVEKYWIGKQDEIGENDVIASVQQGRQ
jgi:thioredoxin-related protein